MKKLFLLLLAMMFIGFVIGCGADGDTTNINSNAAVPNNEFSKTATVQGTLFDATTGERIGDTTTSSLRVVMVRGASYVTPNLLNTTATSAYMGDFVFTGVPVTINGDATYRMVVTRDNYETFEGYLTLTTSLADQNNDDADTIDTVYNFVRNIYLFPLGETAPDYTLYVEYDHERVVGAEVLIEWKPNITYEGDGETGGQEGPTANFTNYISPADGLLGSLISRTTDSAGSVTFLGTELVLGGIYKITVLPTTHEGIDLRRETVWMTVGESDVTGVIELIAAVPGTQGEGLFVTHASNWDSDDALSTGVLTVVFSQAVTLVDEEDCTAALGSQVTAVLDASDPVTAVVSGSGYTLTLTPKYTTNPADENGLYITYSNCKVTAGDDTYQGTDIFGISTPALDDIEYVDDQGPISGRVNIYAHTD